MCPRCPGLSGHSHSEKGEKGVCQPCVLRLPGFGDRRGKAARTFLTSWAKSAESRGGSPSSGRVQESSAEPWATTRMTPAAEEGTARGPRGGGARLSLDPGSPKLLGRNYPTVPQTRLSPGAGSSCGWRRLMIAVPPPAACASAEPTAPAGEGGAWPGAQGWDPAEV